MELRELKSFVMAARYNSVSKAADELGLGQPTVTTHIKKLENELSMVLFDRVTRPIKLTLWGKTILELVEPLLDGIEMLAKISTEVNSSIENIGVFSKLFKSKLIELFDISGFSILLSAYIVTSSPPRTSSSR